MTQESIDSLLFDYTDGLDAAYFFEDDPADADAPDGDAATEATADEDAAPDVPAPERIAALMASMAPQRDVMMAIIRACESPSPVGEVNEAAAALQAHNVSVFSPADLCRLLQNAGALERVDAAGAPLCDETVQPEVVEEDGETYLVPAEPKEAFWRATEAGLQAAREDDPAARLEMLLAESDEKAPVFLRLIAVLEERGSAKTPELAEAISAMELQKNSGLHVTHFLDRLERAGAVTWDGSWRCTDVARAQLSKSSSLEGGN